VIGLNSVAGPPLEYTGRRSDVFDGAAAVAQSLLADQLAHDVDTLATINDDVTESRGIVRHRLVPYIFVAPTDGSQSGAWRLRSTTAITQGRAGCTETASWRCSGGCWTPAATRSAASC
jgi:hypothetical protein